MLRSSSLPNHIHIGTNLAQYDTTTYRITLVCTGCHVISGQSEGEQETSVIIDADKESVSVLASDTKNVINTGIARGDIVEV